VNRIKTNERKTTKNIYNYIQKNASKEKPLTLENLSKKFNMTLEEIKHHIHLMKYKYNLKLNFKFEIPKQFKKNRKTLCRICKENFGTFREIERIIEEKGTEIRGIFVCDSCYDDIDKDDYQ